MGKDVQAYMNDIQHRRELAEQKHLMSSPEQLLQKLIKQHHLPARTNELSVQYRLQRLRVRRPVEQERMRADFPELHDGVLKFQVIDLLHYNPKCSSAIRLCLQRCRMNRGMVRTLSLHLPLPPQLLCALPLMRIPIPLLLRLQLPALQLLKILIVVPINNPILLPRPLPLAMTPSLHTLMSHTAVLFAFLWLGDDV